MYHETDINAHKKPLLILLINNTTPVNMDTMYDTTDTATLVK